MLNGLFLFFPAFLTLALLYEEKYKFKNRNELPDLITIYCPYISRTHGCPFFCVINTLKVTIKTKNKCKTINE